MNGSALEHFDESTIPPDPVADFQFFSSADIPPMIASFSTDDSGDPPSVVNVGTTQNYG